MPLVEPTSVIVGVSPLQAILACLEDMTRVLSLRNFGESSAVADESDLAARPSESSPCERAYCFKMTPGLLPGAAKVRYMSPGPSLSDMAALRGAEISELMRCGRRGGASKSQHCSGSHGQGGPGRDLGNAKAHCMRSYWVPGLPQERTRRCRRKEKSAFARLRRVDPNERSEPAYKPTRTYRGLEEPIVQLADFCACFAGSDRWLLPSDIHRRSPAFLTMKPAAAQLTGGIMLLYCSSAAGQASPSTCCSQEAGRGIPPPATVFSAISACVLHSRARPSPLPGVRRESSVRLRAYIVQAHAAAASSAHMTRKRSAERTRGLLWDFYAFP